MTEMGTNFVTECTRSLREAAKLQAENLAYGQAESYSDYKYACGIIYGLNLALELVEQSIKTVSKKDRE